MKENILNSAFDINFTELSDTLRLGTDALLLSAYVRESKSASAIEIGAGSGIISLLLSKRSCFAHIYAIEIQNELVKIMEENVIRNGFPDVITPISADIRTVNPDVYKGVSVIFSNPPYMKEECGKASQSVSKQIARHEVFGGISDFCHSASRILKTGGRLYLVYRPDRLETLMYALKSNGFSPKRMTYVHSDTEHSPSSVLCEAVLGGSESLYVTPPLFLKVNGTDSEDLKYIYKNGVFSKKFQKN